MKQLLFFIPLCLLGMDRSLQETYYATNLVYPNYSRQPPLNRSIEKYRYNNESLPDSPLDQPSVVNTYWKSKQDAVQYEKDHAMGKMLLALSGYHQYNLLRRNIAAAIYIGANLKSHREDLPLGKAVSANDTQFLTLLIKNGIPLHHKFIEDATTVPMAEFLLNNGLKINWENYFGQNLLFQSMFENHAPALIKFYKEKGLSPFHFDSHDDSPLHMIGIWCVLDKNSIKKTDLLLENLTNKEIISLITHANKKNETIFDYLKSHKNSDEAVSLENHLKMRLEQALKKD